jgi:Raf kinase inhibitor-like YbhB/YbcL family protein
MKTRRFVLFVTVSLALAAAIMAQAPAGAQRGAPPAGGAPAAAPAAPAMVLTTPGWADGTVIPARYTQAGEQVSPALSWTNAPAATVSLVLHMYDADATPTRGTDTQVHWLMWNMPPTLKGLPENMPKGPTLPDGSRQISATGPQYRGPGAPATGPLHHYMIEIYALDTKIDVPASTAPMNPEIETRTAVFKAMAGHVIGKAVYGGLFHRPQ